MASRGLGIDPYRAPRRALVAGGAGFLGSHLCERLIAAGQFVICLDSLQTGTLDNLAAIAGHPRFRMVTADVIDPCDFDVDDIYNLACPASPPHYQADPIRTTKTSVLGALNLLDLAHRTGARLLQASTSEVYGDPLVHPQREDYWGHVNCTGPRSCYDEGKRCAESLCFDYARHYQLDVRVVRIFNTYGPRMRADDGRVVSNFVVQALQNKDITIYGEGGQTRSFCYVDDLVTGFLAVMQPPLGVGGPLNLGNPGEFSVAELAAIVLDLTGSRSTIVHRPLPADDPRQRKPDISLAKANLGWEPKIDLRTGLVRTIAHFEAQLSRRPRVMRRERVGLEMRL